MVRRSALLWSLFLVLGVVGGCQAILQFDEDKLNTGSGGGGTAGAAGSPIGGTTTQGGGGAGATGAAGGTGGTGGAMPECTVPDDCPPTGSECIAATCEEGKCGTMGVEAGMPSTVQTPGDCKVAVCNGSGGIVLQDDDADAFDDGQDCTLDTCNAGLPESSPATAGTSCDDGGGNVCDGLGACVGCLSDGDCNAAAPKCVGNVCVPASCEDGVKNGNETDVDCGGVCGATCAPSDTCNAAADCAEGVCTNNKCAAPSCSDAVENGAETDTDCGGATCAKCGPNKGCDTNADCTGNQCTGVGGACVPNCNDGVKNNAETGVDCGGGTCGGCGAGGPCAQDNDCVGTAYCDGGTCVAKKPNGTTCAAGNQCASGACADGLCCNTACNGTCQACNLAGSAGTCAPIAAGQDPIDECAGAMVCDGAGACEKGIGQTCASSGECALGNCVDGVCCNSACNAACQACSAAGSCTNIPAGQDPASECPGSISCNGNGACSSLLPNGTACTINGECQSGACTDGVCCNSACNGTCQACNLAGSVGACTSIASGQDPANECANGACSGAGSCKLDNGQPCGAGSACLSNACADGVCCNTACGALCQACNVAGSVGTCSNVANGQDPASECAGSTTCNGAGACTTLPNGSACGANGECSSGLCVDGVCCNTACSGLCQACNNAGSLGACTNVANGQDPANECSGTAVCNGSGSCVKPLGSTCAANNECSSGFCADGVCCNTGCSGTCQSCNLAGTVGTCSNVPNGQDPSNECTGATNCNGAGACVLLPQGSACTTAAECGTGFCVDGVCCNTSCVGLCRRCDEFSIQGVGTCGFIECADPDSECVGSQLCQLNGTCNNICF